MEDFFAIPEEKLKYTARALRKELIARGWTDVKAVCSKMALLLFATRPDGKKIRFSPCTPYATSKFATIIADDKLASYTLLKEAGINQPETIRLNLDKTKWREELAELLVKHKRIVVKPVGGAHGRSVTVNIESVDEALEAAFACGDDVIAQEQLEGDEIEVRAICIGYKFSGAYKRIPAAVEGDGKHTILELIDIENREKRGEAYGEKLAQINYDAAKDYLEKNHIDTARVPAVGEKVRVMKICNSGAGGTMEYTELDPERVAIAEKAAKTADLPVVGVDFYGDKVIEINAGPSLYHPTGDKWAMHSIEAYVDYLEQL